jgi:hypothetical protein
MVTQYNGVSRKTGSITPRAARIRALSRRVSRTTQQPSAALVHSVNGPATGARTDRAHVPFRWQAIAADGKLFTALDADLMLVPAGDQIRTVALTGAYRPQWPSPERSCLS